MSIISSSSIYGRVFANSGGPGKDPVWVSLKEACGCKPLAEVTFYPNGMWLLKPARGQDFQTLATSLSALSKTYPQFKDLTAEKLRYLSGLQNSQVDLPFDGERTLHIQKGPYAYQWSLASR